jgi:hypothetical protein
MRQSTITYFNSTGGDGDQHLDRIWYRVALQLNLSEYNTILCFSQYLQAESAARKRNIDFSTFTTLNAKVMPSGCSITMMFMNTIAGSAPSDKWL